MSAVVFAFSILEPPRRAFHALALARLHAVHARGAVSARRLVGGRGASTQARELGTTRILGTTNLLVELWAADTAAGGAFKLREMSDAAADAAERREEAGYDPNEEAIASAKRKFKRALAKMKVMRSDEARRSARRERRSARKKAKQERKKA